MDRIESTPNKLNQLKRALQAKQRAKDGLRHKLLSSKGTIGSKEPQLHHATQLDREILALQAEIRRLKHESSNLNPWESQ